MLRATQLVASLASRGIRCLALAKTEPKLLDMAEGEEDKRRTEGREVDEKKEEEESEEKVEAHAEHEEWKLVCLLSFLDPVRPDARRTIALARSLGVPVKMITGDQFLIARETSKQLGLGVKTILGPNSLPLLNSDGSEPANLIADYGCAIESADGFAQVFPQVNPPTIYPQKSQVGTCTTLISR